MPLPHRLRQAAWAALIALAACRPSLAPPSGNIAAALGLPTLDGAPFDPQQLGGRAALVAFWRPGCPHCIADLPRIARAARARGAASVAVMVAGKPDQARLVVQRTGFTGIVLVDDGSLRKQLDIRKVPYTLVLRRDGTAAAAFLGEQEEQTFLDALADLE
jgi:thiol-disulfide isomerase/thioredoxin